MERMIIPSDARHVLCAASKCEKNVPLSAFMNLEILERGFTVARCECGKMFEVEFETVVE